MVEKKTVLPPVPFLRRACLGPNCGNYDEVGLVLLVDFVLDGSRGLELDSHLGSKPEGGVPDEFVQKDEATWMDTEYSHSLNGERAEMGQQNWRNHILGRDGLGQKLQLEAVDFGLVHDTPRHERPRQHTVQDVSHRRYSRG